MARGEGRTVSKAEPAADIAPPLTRTIAQLMSLIGGLNGAGVRVRLVVAFVLTLVSKVLAVISPLVLADGINALSAGDGSGALATFLGLAGFWGALRFASTAGPQIRDAIFQPVSEEAQRRAGTRVFTHVHNLSVRFHQSKRTGAVYRYEPHRWPGRSVGRCSHDAYAASGDRQPGEVGDVANVLRAQPVCGEELAVVRNPPHRVPQQVVQPPPPIGFHERAAQVRPREAVRGEAQRSQDAHAVPAWAASAVARAALALRPRRVRVIVRQGDRWSTQSKPSSVP